MKFVTLDYETFFDTKSKEPYSLGGTKKLPTVDYVRDDRFQAIILSIAEREYDAPVSYVGPDAIADFIKSYDWSDACTIMHNAAFDASAPRH